MIKRLDGGATPHATTPKGARRRRTPPQVVAGARGVARLELRGGVVVTAATAAVKDAAAVATAFDRVAVAAAGGAKLYRRGADVLLM